MFHWYPDLEYHFAQVQLALFMLGMGATLSFGDFAEVFRKPRSFLFALAGQLFVIPWVAVGLNATGWWDDGVAVGLILVAAMPGGAMSKFFTYFGRGNVALSISLTGVGTLATLFTVPLMLKWLASRYIPADVPMPVGWIVVDVALFLLLPVVVGMSIGRRWPSHKLRFSKICVRLGLAVVVMMIAGSLGSGRIRPGQHGWTVPLAIIFFCVAGMQINMLPFRLRHWPRADRLSAGIEVTMRNMNLALLLTARLFPPTEDETVDRLGEGVLFVVLFYAAAAMGAGLLLAFNHRRMHRRAELHELAQQLAQQPVTGENEVAACHNR
jgi:BASS family bile acid:Na+ symporter